MWKEPCLVPTDFEADVELATGSAELDGFFRLPESNINCCVITKGGESHEACSLPHTKAQLNFAFCYYIKNLVRILVQRACLCTTMATLGITRDVEKRLCCIV